MDTCVYDFFFDSESALELNPEVVTLTPGAPCINSVPTITKIVWMDLSHGKESNLFTLCVRNIFSQEFEYRAKSS